MKREGYYSLAPPPAHEGGARPGRGDFSPEAAAEYFEAQSLELDIQAAQLAALLETEMERMLSEKDAEHKSLSEELVRTRTEKETADQRRQDAERTQLETEQRYQEKMAEAEALTEEKKNLEAKLERERGINADLAKTSAAQAEANADLAKTGAAQAEANADLAKTSAAQAEANADLAKTGAAQAEANAILAQEIEVKLAENSKLIAELHGALRESSSQTDEYRRRQEEWQHNLEETIRREFGESASEWREQLNSLRLEQAETDKRMAEINKSLETLAAREETPENQTRTQELLQEMSGLKETIYSLNDKIGRVDSQVADRLAANAGKAGGSTPIIFTIVTEARLNVTNTFEAERWGPGDYGDKFETSPLEVAVAGRHYLVASARNIGLFWRHFNKPMTKISLRLAKRGDNSYSEAYEEIHYLPKLCNIALITPRQQVKNPLILYRNLNEAFANSDPARMYSYSYNEKVTYAPLQQYNVRISQDRAKKRLNLAFGGSKFADKRNLKEGDYLVTGDGHLLGLMINKDNCQIVTEEDFSPAPELVLDARKGLAEAARQARNYQDSCNR